MNPLSQTRMKPNSLSCLVLLALGASLALWFSTATPCHAGGGPENLLLVVNRDSADSRAIAERFAELRQIPDVCVYAMDGIPRDETITLDQFRDSILKPILAEMESRGIRDQIDMVIYSSGFPTRVKNPTHADMLPAVPYREALKPAASITALTFFYRQVLDDDPTYMLFYANRYASMPAKESLQRARMIPGQEAYVEALDKFNSGRFVEAQSAFELVANANGKSADVLYWQASAAARAGDSGAAIELLGNAIDRGWSFRSYLEADPSFSNLRELSTYQSLVDRLPEDALDDQNSKAFSGALYWSPGGFPVEIDAGHIRYLPSMMLAVTGDRGLTVDQATAALERSVAADFTNPQGEFLYCGGGGPRVNTRRPGFQPAIEAIRRLGFRARFISSPVPSGRDNVAGVMLGRPSFDLAGSDCTLLPGAIAENLTSHGGNFEMDHNHTLCTEPLKHGSAGSSGTVVEPYALQPKFPHPFLQVHYARGMSLIESFYLSTTGPYQLLIVGDPLCQPWADAAEFDVTGVRDRERVSGSIEVTAKATGDVPIEWLAAYVDGVRVAAGPANEPLEIGLAEVDTGTRELRIVAIGPAPTRTTSRKILEVVVD